MSDGHQYVVDGGIATAPAMLGSSDQAPQPVPAAHQPISRPIRDDLISIDDAVTLSGFQRPWLIRKMNEHGVTRIGNYLDYAEFKAAFSQMARMRQGRLVGRQVNPRRHVPVAPMSRSFWKSEDKSTGGSAMDLVASILKGERQ